MGNSVTVEVKPRVMKWLIDSSGWTVEDISKRLKTSEDNVKKFLTGETEPTFNQLEQLATIFKRPVGAFFLDAPKEEKPKPKDYRLLPGKEGVFDKKTLLVLRNARKLQDLSYELSRNIKFETRPDLPKYGLDDSPEKSGIILRQLFEVTKEKQESFKDSYKFFNYLREECGNHNIFVFQFSMPVEDARGFVLVDEDPKIIVVNTKDDINARIFSLAHELGHVLLGESVIDLPDITSEKRNAIENWCNKFAASFLLPKDAATKLFERQSENLTDSRTLRILSNKYKVSKAMLLYNMRRLNFISADDYTNVIDRYKPKPVSKKKQEKGKGGGVSGDKRALSKVGEKFVALVADNYDKEFITYSDALNYLSIKSPKFEKLLSRAKK